MEVSVVAQRHSQEHLQSIMVSGVAAEPYHADPTLQENPIKEEAMVTDDRDDIPEDTTITEGVVVVAVEVET